MKKRIVVFATILSLGIVAADAVLQQPVAAYAAAQTSDTQTEQPKDNTKDGQGGKADDGHSGHH